MHWSWKCQDKIKEVYKIVGQWGQELWTVDLLQLLDLSELSDSFELRIFTYQYRP